MPGVKARLGIGRSAADAAAQCKMGASQLMPNYAYYDCDCFGAKVAAASGPEPDVSACVSEAAIIKYGTAFAERVTRKQSSLTAEQKQTIPPCAGQAVAAAFRAKPVRQTANLNMLLQQAIQKCMTR